jgi:hypothetical protein
VLTFEDGGDDGDDVFEDIDELESEIPTADEVVANDWDYGWEVVKDYYSTTTSIIQRTITTITTITTYQAAGRRMLMEHGAPDIYIRVYIPID